MADFGLANSLLNRLSTADSALGLLLALNAHTGLPVMLREALAAVFLFGRSQDFIAQRRPDLGGSEEKAWARQKGQKWQRAAKRAFLPPPAFSCELLITLGRS